MELDGQDVVAHENHLVSAAPGAGEEARTLRECGNFLFVGL